MRVGGAAEALVGIPHAHCEGFRTVARAERCVLVSRAVGPVCTLLIEEGYAMKSFRIHGKSSDWGPMAGFVVRDPRLSKLGLAGEADQRKEHARALTDSNRQGWRSGTDVVKISSARLAWLKANNARYELGIAFGRSWWLGRRREFEALDLTASRGGVCVPFTLIRRRPGDLWGVFIDRRLAGRGFRQEAEREETFGPDSRFEALVGMTNPYKEYAGENAYKNVVTGDYDLFAVWPEAGLYRHEGADRRLAGTMGGGKGTAATKQVFAREQIQIGNVTDRIYQVAQMLNSVIGAMTGLPNRNVCFHSDEAGRPMVDEIDAPLIAFVPTPAGVKTYGIEKGTKERDLKALVEECLAAGYRVTLHPAWARQMGLAPADVASLVPAWDGGGDEVVESPWYFPSAQVEAEKEKRKK